MHDGTAMRVSANYFKRVMMYAVAPVVLLAQTAGDTKVSTEKPKNHRYTIAVLQPTKPAESQTVVNALVQKMTAKGFVRIQTLDVQCCIVQVELLSLTPHDKQVTLATRIVVLDVDKENVYSKEYQGSAGSLNSAAANIAAEVLSDAKFLRVMGGS